MFACHAANATIKVMAKVAQKGFVLPTIVIAAVVLMTVLTATVSLMSGMSASVTQQYLDQLSREAAESGANHIAACMNSGTFVAGTTITPQTNCTGAIQSGASLYLVKPQSGQAGVRSYYQAKYVTNFGSTKTMSIVGYVEQIRAGGAVYNTVKNTMMSASSTKPDLYADRANKRYWYFGSGAGLDFGVSGKQLPSPIPMLESSNAQMGVFGAAEGTTTVSDSEGNFLFAGDGMSLRDRAGNLMQGSFVWNAAKSRYDSLLYGASTPTQGIAAFPMDMGETKYGVVSNTGSDCPNGGVWTDNYPCFGVGELYLHIVDMTQNNGYGAVTSKNIPLYGSTKDYSSEATNAMPNADGSGYWVYTYKTAAGQIYGFQIKNNGTITGPVITSVPPPVWCKGAIVTGNAGYTAFGSINFSKNYSRMVVNMGSYPCGSGPPYDSGSIYLLDTNRMTGALTLKANWTQQTLDNDGGSGYGADFSPGESFVYTTSLYPPRLQRYSISNPSNVQSTVWHVTETGVYTPPTDQGGAIRRGPDDRMYIANLGTNYISYIDNPDQPAKSLDAIGYRQNGLKLGPGAESRFGLPQMATVFQPFTITY